MRDKARGVRCMLGDAGALLECGDTLMTPDHTSSRCAALGRVESFWEFIETGATKKLRFVVHAASSSSWLATLHGAPWTHVLMLSR